MQLAGSPSFVLVPVSVLGLAQQGTCVAWQGKGKGTYGWQCTGSYDWQGKGTYCWQGQGKGTYGWQGKGSYGWQGKGPYGWQEQHEGKGFYGKGKKGQGKGKQVVFQAPAPRRLIPRPPAHPPPTKNALQPME